MAWMSEFSSTILACKPALIVVDQHVVVKAVLAGKGCFAYKAHKRFNTWNKTIQDNSKKYYMDAKEQFDICDIAYSHIYTKYLETYDLS